MKFLGLLLMLWIDASSSHIQQAMFELMANVTLLLTREHSARCIQIFRPDLPTNEDWEKIKGLWRLLAVPQSHTTIGIYSFTRYINRKKQNPWKVSCYKPMKVLFGNDGSRTGYAALTQELRVKDSVWLWFLDSDENDFFREANMLFDCLVIVAKIQTLDLVTLNEVYRVRQDFPLRSLYYGNWTRQRGLDVPSNTLYERRFDLEGLVLKAGAIQNWPMTWVDDSKWVGFLPRIWSEVEILTNSSTEYYESVDGLTGLKTSDNMWNGLVGMTLRGDIDLIISEITIEKTRSHVLDIFHPLISTSYQLYFRQLGYNLQWDSVFKPFAKSIWFSILFWILIGSTVLSICYHISLTYGFEKDSEKIFSPIGSFFFVLQTLSQQGHYTVPSSAPCRMLFLIAYLVSAVLIPSYSASLISYLTQEVPYRPFNSLEEMHRDGRYRLLLKESTAEYGYFKYAKSQLLKDIFKQQIQTVPPEHAMFNTSHAFHTLCEYPNYAFLGIEVITNIRLGRTIKPDCPIITMTQPISSIYLTMATIKNSPYSSLINHFLMKMLATGVAKRIQTQEFPGTYQEPAPPQREVALGEVFQMFVLLGFSAAMSIFILLIEKMCHKRRRKERQRPKWNIFRGYQTALVKNCGLQAKPKYLHGNTAFMEHTTYTSISVFKKTVIV